MQKILSVGSIPDLLKQRTAALTAAGLSVSEAAGLAQGLRMINADQFEIVILGYSLQSDERDKLARAVRRCMRDCKIIMLYEGRITGTEMADAIIAADDPQRVVEAIQMLSEARSRTDAKSRTECA